MEITIIDRVQNAELNREEITFQIDHSRAQTPSRATVIAKLAAIINSEKERTILRSIKGSFGLQQSIGYATLYETAEEANEIELDYLLKRNGLMEKDFKDE
ncbi:MAG: 30S ribosomal protein S24e [Candidatus Heimdallarchaeota archaeon]|nr:30S ribosomal protein S24e [Candidatus Heimdallarchaeota archaeon]